MFNFRSLTAKFVFIGCIMLAYIAAYITVTYHFTHYMRGEARRINLTGKERMLVVETAKHLLEISDLPLSLERSYILEDMKKKINTYEEIILGLRDGSAKHNLLPIHSHANNAINQNNKLIEMWQKIQKPELDGLANMPDKIKLRAFNLKIYSYLEEIDKLVYFIERHTEEEINNFDTFRNYSFGVLFILTIFILFYTRKSIVNPVLKLKEATKAIAGGNFDVRAEITTSDEIGTLCLTFNNMAQSIDTLFKEKTEHLRELETLYRLSSAISKSLSVEEIANIALDEIMNLEDPRMEKKGIIFIADTKKQVLNLIAYRGVSEEFAKAEAVVPIGDCICGLVAETGKEIIATDCCKDARHIRTTPETQLSELS